MYPANLSFKNEREINSLTDNRKEGRREGGRGREEKKNRGLARSATHPVIQLLSGRD